MERKNYITKFILNAIKEDLKREIKYSELLKKYSFSPMTLIRKLQKLQNDGFCVYLRAEQNEQTVHSSKKKKSS